MDVLVDFPVNGLDLSELVLCPETPEAIYDLYAVSNHFGGMGGGHCELTPLISSTLVDTHKHNNTDPVLTLQVLYVCTLGKTVL